MQEMVSMFLIHNSKLTTFNWNQWIKLCFDFAENKKIQFSHIGIKSESLYPNKLRTFKYKKIIDRIGKIVNIINGEVNILPKDEVFNYNVNRILQRTSYDCDKRTNIMEI